MSSFPAILSFQGKTHTIEVNTTTTVSELLEQVKQECQLEHDHAVKVLYNGKMLRIDNKNSSSDVVFPKLLSKPPKLLVIASSRNAVQKIQSKRSDPTIRGFETSKVNNNNYQHNARNVWGTTTTTGQDAQYKFVRFEVCTWQSFGHRVSDGQPHAFAAQQLLEQLATDPGVVAVMQERKLVVNTLGEMDPIDDRLMQKKQAEQHGTCLLGYNTNHGLAIHIRLRTMDLKGFLPYPQLVSTLIHELSHNWVGEHNLLFWGNYAQMRVEYLHTHARLQGTLCDGRTTAMIAGVSEQCRLGMAGIADAVMKELSQEMPQYGLSPLPLRQAIIDRCQQLTDQYENLGHKLGGSHSRNDLRRAALEAAEKRAREGAQDNNNHGDTTKS